MARAGDDAAGRVGARAAEDTGGDGGALREVDVDGAVRVLASGGLVALPTETVYGLAADATNEAAIARVFEVKGRPRSHPLILHLADVGDLDAWVDLGGWAGAVAPLARRLADVLWPGPLTLVLPRGARVSAAVTGGRDTVAVRVPRHPLARAVIRGLGRPVAAPSANRFGAVSPTRAAHVREDLAGTDVALLDGGPAEVGLESTIVDVSGGAPRVLRPGGISAEALADVLGVEVPLEVGGEARAPGMLPSHYAPRARVVAVPPEALEATVASLAPTHAPGTLAAVSPDPPSSPGLVAVRVPEDGEARARGLYDTLRALDARGVQTAVVALPDPGGLGLAVADRLRRAAAPRG